MKDEARSPQSVGTAGRCSNASAKAQSLPRVQRKVYDFLAGGVKYSAADISKHLGVSDPRGHIRALRGKGFAISDEWRETAYGARYKVYFILPKAEV